MQKCKNIIRKFVNYGSTVVVSCSGGPDSMCLLKNIVDLKSELALNIIVAHINHNVREESDAEEEMVNNYCNSNKLIFEKYKITNYTNENFHNEARIIRYDFMKQIIKKYEAKYLFTAHHADDLMETIFMRIARGSNLKGYSGFKMIDYQDGYTVVRPLIFNTKDEIIKYNDNNGIPYAIDKTNYSDDYTRNRYRNHVLPFLKAENKDIHLKYIEYSNRLNAADEFIDKIVNEKISKIYNKNKLCIKEIFKIDDYLIPRIIEKMLYYTYKDKLYLIGDKHINEIIKLIKSKGNRRISLPDNYEAIKEYEYLSINKYKTVNNYNEQLNSKVIIPELGSVIITSEIGSSNYYLKLNSKEVKLPLYVRNRQDKDTIETKNLNGHQKIKKIFIDYKIPKDKRDIWPILCDSNGNVLWVPGLKKSKFDKDNDELYDIIIKYEEENNE